MADLTDTDIDTAIERGRIAGHQILIHFTPRKAHAVKCNAKCLQPHRLRRTVVEEFDVLRPRHLEAHLFARIMISADQENGDALAVKQMELFDDE